MGYKPTIGGLENLQDFLGQNEFDLPNFYMDVRGGGMLGAKPGEDISPKLIAFEAAKTLYGANTEVDDVRLSNQAGDSFIQFSKPVYYGLFTALSASEEGMDVVIETHKDDIALTRFLGSRAAQGWMDIARWGKRSPTLMDKFVFRYFSTKYNMPTLGSGAQTAS